MSISRTELVPPDPGDLHLCFFRLDNNIFPFTDVCSRLSSFVPIGPLVCVQAQTPLALMSWGVAVVHPCRLFT